jgi:two-component system response regulator AlgR
MQILVVDDQVYFRAHLSGWLRMLQGIVSVQAVASALEALTVLDTMKPDVVITDLRMPEMDGFELTRKIKSRAAAPIVVVMTSLKYSKFHEQAVEVGADYSLEKLDMLEQLPVFLEKRFGVGGMRAD